MSDFEIYSGIIIPLVSALIGGGITLLGVILTIKHTNKTRKKDILELYKPVIRCFSPLDDYDYKNSKRIKITDNKNKLYIQSFCGVFYNTDKANFELDEVIINDKVLKIDNNRYIRKSEIFELCIDLNEENKPKEVKLKIYDDFNKTHVFKILYKIKNETINIFTSIEEAI